jgi:hypothetical protein
MDQATEEVTLAELLDMAMDGRQVDMHTAFPAKVDSYDNSKQTINCTPQVRRHLPDGQGNWIDEPLPALADVPVCFPRVGGFFLSFPIQAGDYVLIVVCQKNLSVWRASGTANDPGDLGMHTLDGAIAIPGIFPDSKKLSNSDSTNMVLGSDTDGDSRIEIKPSGGINLGASASQGILTQKDFETFLHAWQTAAVGTNDGGALMRTNTITALGTVGWSVGAGLSGLGSTKVKANR